MIFKLDKIVPKSHDNPASQWYGQTDCLKGYEMVFM